MIGNGDEGHLHCGHHHDGGIRSVYRFHHPQQVAAVLLQLPMCALAFNLVRMPLAACDAEVVFWGANYDQDLTWPPFFREEIAPWLKRVSDRLHAAGKFLLTHTDGENKALLPLYPACGFDVAESVCPAPMTQCTLAEVRTGMGPNVTVWGGIPSVALLEESMSESAFERYLDDLFGSLGGGGRLILGVSDNVPPKADLGRLARIKERAEAFKPSKP